MSGSWTPNGRFARLGVALTLLVAGLLLLGPVPAQAQPAFVTGQVGYNFVAATNTLSVTLPSPSTTGNLIVLSFEINTPGSLTVTSVTDNKGNTYSVASGPLNWNGSSDQMWTYYASNITGGGAPVTVTVTLSGATTGFLEGYVLEYSGVAQTSPVDQTSSGFGVGTVMSSGSKTTTSPSELIYGACLVYGIPTVDPPFTARDTSNNNFVADRTVSATGSYAVTGTMAPSAAWGCQMVTFKAPPATPIFYSVGTSAADLKTAGTQMTIAAGVATFDRAQANNVGVGDQITYPGPTIAFISGRTSSTQYSVTTRLGVAPANVGAPVAVTSILRAFNSLSLAKTGSTNGTHLGTNNLTGGNFQLNWPCYNDAVMSNSINIAGADYTTGPTNYIRIYTPTSSSEVGVSQRHTGVFGTGFQLSVLNGWAIANAAGYVRIEGLLILATVNNNNNAGGITSVPAGAADVRISHNIIKGAITGTATGFPSGIQIGGNNLGVHRIWNNVVYNFTHATVEAAQGIGLNDGVAYVFNNTVFNCNTGIIKFSGQDAGTEVKNNASLHDTVTFPTYVDYKYLTAAPAATRVTNVSSDTTSETVALRSKTAFASYFKNTAATTEDFHLLNTSLSLWTANGTDLSADPNLPVTNDIDGVSRVRPDIGADEFSATALFRSVGITGTALATGAANALTISGSTATFGIALPTNIGVGDVIQYDSNNDASIDALAFIHGRTNSQTYTVKNSAGGTPIATVTPDNNWDIFRAYDRLSRWESQTENTNITPALMNFDTSTDLVGNNTSMLVACYADGADPLAVTISGWTTDASHYIHIFTPNQTSQVGTSQRHSGVWDLTKYRLVASRTFNGLLWIQEEFVRVTGLQIENTGAKGSRPAGIELEPGSATAEFRVSKNILRATGGGTGDWWASAIVFKAGGGVLKAWNNIMYTWGGGVFQEYTAATHSVTLYNNTIVNPDNVGIELDGDGCCGTIRLANNLVQGTPSNACYYFAGGVLPLAYSATNLSQDLTSPQAGGCPGPTCYRGLTVTFVGAPNYHLSPADVNAKDRGTNLSADPVLAVVDDIDGQVRQVAWDIGADDANGTTAVKLMSFSATGVDRAVELKWETGSELDNLGFHVYRGLSEGSPWTRLTTSLIPGLGSSAVGRAYSFRDGGLVNGTSYFYRLEDVDASSKVTSHGPVSAMPQAGAAGGAPGSDAPTSGGKKKGAASQSCPDWVVAAYGSMANGSPSADGLRCTRHGDPEAVSLGVVSRDSRQATLELRTGGFYALHTPPGAGEASGRVRVFVPGFDSPQDPQAAALPVRRALVDAVVGRRVQLGGVRGLDQVAFRGLVPASLGQAEMEVSRDGTIRAGRRAVRESSPQHASLDLARLLPSVFQGETKSAVVEMTPLRYDARRRQIVLAKRVLVKLLFTGRETGEHGRGSFGRKQKAQKPVGGEVLARLHTTGRGLYAVSFEQLFPGRQRGLASSQLRLERQGQARAFHIAPVSDAFGPGSMLYFHADATASSTDFSSETAWELLRAEGGVRMPLVSARASGEAITTASTGRSSFETNRFYQPGLLDAPDPWLWEALASGATRAKSFSLGGVDAASSQAAALEVFLQGASESGNPVDHHVSVSLNGMPVGEAQFAGKTPHRMSLSVPQSVLREGANELSLTNVADTGVSSFVFLDHFTVSYPQAASLASGVFEGTWADSGTATVSGTSGAVALLDVTASRTSGASPTTSASASGASWVSEYESAGSALRFRAEAGHRYLAVSQPALLTPRVGVPAASSLRSPQNRADYLLIAPRAFLAAAEPLLQRRHDQGLQTRAVAFEEISDEFGHGQPSAESIQSFLSFAFQSWARPSPRYVLLLGDSSYDPRNFTGTSQPSPLPALWTKTSYLWTVSDPQLAAVNGEDALPDIAIGRLPAATVEEARMLVEKLISWEDSGQGLAGAAALVADNPDIAGDFEADVRDIAASYLSDRSPQQLLLSQLGSQTRPRILDALNSGLSFLSYVGHGGAAVWASENVWNSWDAASLQAQSRQPLLLTLNCLNGYFVAPAFNSLSESLLKAEGRGAIAGFSPSGLSLDGPAHQYHRALMAELTGGQHLRLGDALTAAQKAYAQTGLMPELLSVYHLLGDPGMQIR